MKRLAPFFTSAALFMVLSLLLCACSPSDEVSSDTSAPLPVITVSGDLTLAEGTTAGAPVTVEGAGDLEVLYRSSNTSVADVDDDGTVRGIATGTAVITVSVETGSEGGTVSETFNVTVIAVLAEIRFAAAEITVVAGSTGSQEPIFLPEGANIPELTYRSDNENAAVVDEEGVVTGVSAGSCVITLSSEDGISGSYRVNVIPALSDILIDKSALLLNVGDTAKLNVSLVPDGAQAKIDFSCSDTSVATVDESGNVTAVSPGSAVIKVAAGDFTAECAVTVNEKNTYIPVTGILIASDTVTLHTGADEYFDLNAQVVPQNATNTHVTYSTSDRTVATVDKSGRITVAGVGTARITVSAADGVTAVCKVTVEEQKRTEAPKVIDHSFLTSDRLIIIGTCEDNAKVTASNGSDSVTTTADKKYFSVSLPVTGSTTSVTITATAEGKKASESVKYSVPLASPPSSRGQWSLIWGTGYHLFLSHVGNTDLGYGDIMRTNGLTSAQLDSFVSNVNRKVDALKSINPEAELIYLIVPSAATVYPEDLPDYITPTNGESRLEQVTQALGRSKAICIDMLEVMREHKNDPLKAYWNTDTHWSDYGGFLAYTELFKVISEKFPAASPRPITDFTFKEDYYYGGDMSVYLEIRKDLMQEWGALRVPNFEMPGTISRVQRYVSDRQLTYNPSTMEGRITTRSGNSSLPDVLIHRDSFSTQMFDIVSERCNFSLWYPMWSYALNTSDIRSYGADYVIYIINERNIGSILY